MGPLPDDCQISELAKDVKNYLKEMLIVRFRIWVFNKKKHLQSFVNLSFALVLPIHVHAP